MIQKTVDKAVGVRLWIEQYISFFLLVALYMDVRGLSRTTAAKRCR